MITTIVNTPTIDNAMQPGLFMSAEFCTPEKRNASIKAAAD